MRSRQGGWTGGAAAEGIGIGRPGFAADWPKNKGYALSTPRPLLLYAPGSNILCAVTSEDMLQFGGRMMPRKW